MSPARFFAHLGELKLPFELEVLIPDDDPVRLLSAFVEELELEDLYHSYGKIKSGQATPRQLFKIVVYAAMNRSIQAECLVSCAFSLEIIEQIDRMCGKWREKRCWQ